MKIENLIKKYQNELAPTREQERRVANRVFAELGKNSSKSYFSNLISMIKKLFNKKSFKVAFATGIFAAALLMPSLFYFQFNPFPQNNLIGEDATISGVKKEANDDIPDYTYKPNQQNNNITPVPSGSPAKAGYKPSSGEMLVDGNTGDNPKIVAQPSKDYGYKVPEDTVTPESERVKDKTAFFVLETSEIRENFDKILQKVDQYGGYVKTSNLSLKETKSEAKIILRVPSDKFNDVLNEIRGLKVRIIT